MFLRRDWDSYVNYIVKYFFKLLVLFSENSFLGKRKKMEFRFNISSYIKKVNKKYAGIELTISRYCSYKNRLRKK